MSENKKRPDALSSKKTVTKEKYLKLVDYSIAQTRLAEWYMEAWKNIRREAMNLQESKDRASATIQRKDAIIAALKAELKQHAIRTKRKRKSSKIKK